MYCNNIGGIKYGGGVLLHFRPKHLQKKMEIMEIKKFERKKREKKEGCSLQEFFPLSSTYIIQSFSIMIMQKIIDNKKVERLRNKQLYSWELFSKACKYLMEYLIVL